jgi:uncharacterized phiE125 gp8 family phage protein
MNELVTNLIVTTPPASEPVTLADARLHCRVEISDDDALISALITAAREYCEKEVRRAFITRSYQLRMTRFPYSVPIAYYPFYTLERMPNQLFGTIELPRPPLISVDAVKYIDANGTLQTLDPTLYQVESGGVCQGLITPAYGLLFPVTRYEMGAVQVNFTAGYSDPTQIPSSLKAAMKLCIGHWYRNREAVSEGSFAEVPMAVPALLSSLEWGFYG